MAGKVASIGSHCYQDNASHIHSDVVTSSDNDINKEPVD